MEFINAMRLELNQTIGIRAKIEYILDLLIDILLEIKDFTVIHAITFGEMILFALAIGRAIWYVVFGVYKTSFDYYFSESTWTFIFVGCSLVHLTSFFFNKNRLRVGVILFYAFVWTFLGILAAFSRTPAPAIPTFGVFALASIFLAVRLSHENK